jgi:hypothetical protein
LKEEINNFVNCLYDEIFYESHRWYEDSYLRLDKCINRIPSGTFSTLECSELYNILSDCKVLLCNNSDGSLHNIVCNALIDEINRMNRDD